MIQVMNGLFWIRRYSLNIQHHIFCVIVQCRMTYNSLTWDNWPLEISVQFFSADILSRQCPISQILFYFDVNVGFLGFALGIMKLYIWASQIDLLLY